ncbi:alginate lyase family protein [Arcticibacter sp.]|uniref:alginate lyase family protein n=1 Tax=Arcticibacter sp. TaxID=1872630 RepID=UPI00388E8C75
MMLDKYVFCIVWLTGVAVSHVFGVDIEKKAVSVLRKQVMEEALWALQQQPVTITAEQSERSAGGKHDFYSEGDYWWPDSTHPAAPYVQRDGLTNPQNFTAHRKAMIRFSQIIGALASAYKITGDERYVKHAIIHLKAWFVDPETLMNPHLLYAQAIKGRFTGRGIGIIDTIQLMEVAQGILVMESSRNMPSSVIGPVKSWFASYIKWLTDHPYGKDEMNAENNHGTCWVMQVASFAKLTGDLEMLDFCRQRFKEVLLPMQMAADGGFPRELKRTKPYGYSLFNLDAMSMICQILSDDKQDLWSFKLADGRSMNKGVSFLHPFIEDKAKWPFQQDVMYWDQWPVAHPSLLFAARAFGNKRYFETWKRLDHQPETEEVIRNLPVRHPVIWF